MNEDAYLDSYWEDQTEVMAPPEPQPVLDHPEYDDLDLMRAEMEAEAIHAMYDDDPSPYNGTYSEM